MNSLCGGRDFTHLVAADAVGVAGFGRRAVSRPRPRPLWRRRGGRGLSQLRALTIKAGREAPGRDHIRDQLREQEGDRVPDREPAAGRVPGAGTWNLDGAGTPAGTGPGPHPGAGAGTRRGGRIRHQPRSGTGSGAGAGREGDSGRTWKRDGRETGSGAGTGREGDRIRRRNWTGGRPDPAQELDGRGTRAGRGSGTGTDECPCAPAGGPHTAERFPPHPCPSDAPPGVPEGPAHRAAECDRSPRGTRHRAPPPSPLTRSRPDTDLDPGRERPDA